MPRSPIDQRQKSLKDGTAWRFEHLSLFNRYFREGGAQEVSNLPV
jgi:hypothetical protein